MYRKLLQSAMAALMLSGVSYGAVQVKVLFTPAIPVMPFVYGSKVLIQDYVQGSYRLRSIDVSSGAATEVRNNGQSYLYPIDFGGTHVAWISYSTTGGMTKRQGPTLPQPIPTDVSYYVKLFKISGASEQNATSNTSYKEQLAIDNSAVVWTDYRHYTSSDTTIEIYYNGGSAEQRIATRKGYKSAPDIRGKKIVWQDYRNATSANRYNADIYFYDITAGTEKAICTESHYQDQPSVYGNYVVWQDYRNTGSNSKNADIYLYDLSKNQEKAICTAPSYQSQPQVYGNYIVWHDYRNATTDTMNADIYLYDISTGIEMPVTTKAGYQGPPYLYGSNVTWYDYTDNKVYIAHLDGTGVVVATPVPEKTNITPPSLIITTEKQGVYYLTGQVMKNAGANNRIHRISVLK